MDFTKHLAASISRWTPCVVFVACAGMRTASAQDVRRVVADNPPDWGNSAAFVHQFTIGELDGPPEYSLGRVLRAAIESDGAFYLYDDNDVQIRRYDARGVFERRIGRKGGGPGEYNVVAAMDVTHDGLLVVFDPRTRRITYFRADGKVQREISSVRSADYGDFITDSAGMLYLRIRLPGPLEGPQARHQYVRLAPNGATVDSILHPPQREPLGAGFGLVTSDGMRDNFSPETVVQPYRLGGMLTAESQAYRFRVVSPGRPTLVVEHPYHPVSLNRDERIEWEAWSEFSKPYSLHPARFVVPRVKPPIRGLFSDNSGRVWVDVYVAAEKHIDPTKPRLANRPALTWRERSTYDVFSPAGRYLGRLQLPWESRIIGIGGDRVLVLTRGVDDEDRIGVYRVPSPAR